MKKIISVMMLLALTGSLLTGCSKQSEAAVIENAGGTAEVTAEAAAEEKAMPEKIAGDDYDEYGGADTYGNSGDHADSMYYNNPDFYNMKSSDTLTILTNFKTIQQTTEYSCGAASMLMMLNYLGVDDYTEMDLCIRGDVGVDEDTPDALPGSADNYYEYGASVGKLVQMVDGIEGIEVVETSYREDYSEEELLTAEDGVTPNDIGNLPATFTSSSMYASENSDETDSWVEDAKDSYFVQWITGHLNNGNGIIVEWGDWDGHWQVIIGYDTMGTPSLGDDIIIFADSYDTSDHWQDGYYYYPAERWFYMWKDRNVAPKPFQLQPYVVIGKTN